MKTIKDYIQTISNSHLRNLYIEIDEELHELKTTEHSRNRKDQFKNDTEDISKNEIIEIINKCDDLIVNKLLNNQIEINTHKEQFGIRKLSNKNYKCLAVIFEVVYFNKETFEYDLKIITSNKYKDKIFKFRKDTKFVFEIDKSGYAKEIKI